MNTPPDTTGSSTLPSPAPTLGGRPTTVPIPSLLYWRTQKGWIQVQLAQRAGVDRATIQRLEGGDEARLSTVSKLAAALEVTPADLQHQPPANA